MFQATGSVKPLPTVWRVILWAIQHSNAQTAFIVLKWAEFWTKFQKNLTYFVSFVFQNQHIVIRLTSTMRSLPWRSWTLQARWEKLTSLFKRWLQKKNRAPWHHLCNVSPIKGTWWGAEVSIAHKWTSLLYRGCCVVSCIISPKNHCDYLVFHITGLISLLFLCIPSDRK